MKKNNDEKGRLKRPWQRAAKQLGDAVDYRMMYLAKTLLSNKMIKKSKAFDDIILKYGTNPPVAHVLETEALRGFSADEFEWLRLRIYRDLFVFDDNLRESFKRAKGKEKRSH